MTTAPDASLPEDERLLLHAYLHGELDPIAALEIERRLVTDRVLSAERDRVQALRGLLRERLPREAPSPNLQARIEQAAGLRAMAAAVMARACCVDRCHRCACKQRYPVRRDDYQF